VKISESEIALKLSLITPIKIQKKSMIKSVISEFLNLRKNIHYYCKYSPFILGYHLPPSLPFHPSLFLFFPGTSRCRRGEVAAVMSILRPKRRFTPSFGPFSCCGGDVAGFTVRNEKKNKYSNNKITKRKIT
jgi:hypothetical protein